MASIASMQQIRPLHDATLGLAHASSQDPNQQHTLLKILVVINVKTTRYHGYKRNKPNCLFICHKWPCTLSKYQPPQASCESTKQHSQVPCVLRASTLRRPKHASTYKAFGMQKGARMLQKGIKSKIEKVAVIPTFQVCKLTFWWSVVSSEKVGSTMPSQIIRHHSSRHSLERKSHVASKVRSQLNKERSSQQNAKPHVRPLITTPPHLMELQLQCPTSAPY